MADDLVELHRRIAWCRQKIDALAPEIVRLGERSVKMWMEPFTIRGQQIKARLLAHPSVAIRTEVGLLVHEQRAILDALACVLAIRNGANHTNDVYFPITRDLKGFEELGRRKIRKLETSDQQAIEALKPWGTSDSGDHHPELFLLHEADRVRKHQRLLKWSVYGGTAFVEGTLGVFHGNNVTFETVGKEETLITVLNTTGTAQTELKLIYTEPEALENHSVLERAVAFNGAVETIVSSFD